MLQDVCFIERVQMKCVQFKQVFVCFLSESVQKMEWNPDFMNGY